jgi:hypothetical protein
MKYTREQLNAAWNEHVKVREEMHEMHDRHKVEKKAAELKTRNAEWEYMRMDRANNPVDYDD